MHTPSTPPSRETLILDVVSAPKLARAIRAAYAAGWRDRVAVEAAVRGGDLEPGPGADDVPAPSIEDLYVRLARGE